MSNTHNLVCFVRPQLPSFFSTGGVSLHPCNSLKVCRSLCFHSACEQVCCGSAVLFLFCFSQAYSKPRKVGNRIKDK